MASFCCGNAAQQMTKIANRGTNSESRLNPAERAVNHIKSNQIICMGILLQQKNLARKTHRQTDKIRPKKDIHAITINAEPHPSSPFTPV